MDLREYEQHKFAIADLLRQMELAAPDKQQWRDEATALFTRLAEDRFNLVLVGRFSRGKTSLMNAILGMDQLPTGIIPLTSVITSVAYGSVERVRVRYTKNFMDEDVPLTSLPRYVTQQGNPGNAKGIKEAEVQLPSEFLRRGFHFVDTPGLGSAIEENTRTTESYLPEADAYLLVTSFDSPLSGEEMRFLREVSASSRSVFVVLNKQDMVNDRERGEALDYVRGKLDATFEQNAPKLFSVSARQALAAKQAHDSERLGASGILSLEHELVDFLVTQKRSEFLLRMCDRLADLARRVPASEQTLALAERIAALSRRIGVDNPGRAGSGPVQDSVTAGPTAAHFGLAKSALLLHRRYGSSSAAFSTRSQSILERSTISPHTAASAAFTPGNMRPLRRLREFARATLQCSNIGPLGCEALRRMETYRASRRS
jgi:GTP-binding protein EngB required for normal cell division